MEMSEQQQYQKVVDENEVILARDEQTKKIKIKEDEIIITNQFDKV